MMGIADVVQMRTRRDVVQAVCVVDHMYPIIGQEREARGPFSDDGKPSRLTEITLFRGRS